MAEQRDEVLIDGTYFTFPPHWRVSAFDTWPQFAKAAGAIGLQGCDVVAFDGDTLWLIEMKDYTYPGARPPTDLPTTVGLKAAGTLALLFTLSLGDGTGDARAIAAAARRASAIRLALHVEVKDAGRKGKQVDSALLALQSQMRRVGKALGVKTHVTSTLAPSPHTPWQSRRDPSTRSRHSDR